MNHFKPSGFLFDNDGLVLDTEQALVGINTEMLKPYGIKFDPSTRKFFTGKPDIPGLKVLIEKHNLKGKVSAEELSERRKGILDQWYSEKADFVPGFTDYYKVLRKVFQDIPVAIASGTDPGRYNMADKKRGLREMFDNNICLSRDAKVRHKPEPDIIVYAAGMIRAPVTECVVWEDSPLGLVSSYNAGVRKNICLTRTLEKKEVEEAIQEILGKKLEGEMLFIDGFNKKSLQETIDYIRKI